VVKVLSGQAGYENQSPGYARAPICSWHLETLADKTINPHGETIDAYAIAPYFGGTSIDELASSIPTQVRFVNNHISCLKGTGIPLIAYEGGQDSFRATANGCTVLATDPGMKDLYVTFLNAISTAGMLGPFAQYTHVGQCWGLKIATGDAAASSPKYQGVLDWLATHP
jgi:hypothetical protein